MRKLSYKFENKKTEKEYITTSWQESLDIMKVKSKDENDEFYGFEYVGPILTETKGLLED